MLNDTYPTKFRANIEKRVRRHGIAIVDGDYVDIFPEPNTTVDVMTRKGKVIKNVDLVVRCPFLSYLLVVLQYPVQIPAFGARPNTAFIGSLGAGVLTEQGFVKVKPTLELQDHPGVFAVGDIINWKEQKQAGKAIGHAGVVAANLVSFLDGKPQTKPYKGSPEMIVVPVGKVCLFPLLATRLVLMRLKADGAGYLGFLWGITLGGWLTSLIKGKTLLLPMVRDKLHYA